MNLSNKLHPMKYKHTNHSFFFDLERELGVLLKIPVSSLSLCYVASRLNRFCVRMRSTDSLTTDSKKKSYIWCDRNWRLIELYHLLVIKLSYFFMFKILSQELMIVNEEVLLLDSKNVRRQTCPFLCLCFFTSSVRLKKLWQQKDEKKTPK